MPISQGKQTIVADLIYEEYSKSCYLGFFFDCRDNSFFGFICTVGIDVRQRIPLIKESNSYVQLQRNRKPPSFPSPKELHVIDDDDIVEPQKLIEGQSKNETDSMLVSFH